MAVTTYINQGAKDPLVGQTVITYRGRKNPLPQMNANGTVVVPSGLTPTLYAKAYWRNTTTVDPYPIMQPGSTIPIGTGNHIIPVKPLPGGGGGSSGITVGYGI